MSADVNSDFLVRRARQQAEWLRNRWEGQCVTADLLVDLADALGKATKPAGEAVAAADGVGEGESGVLAGQASSWGESPWQVARSREIEEQTRSMREAFGLETDRNMAGDPKSVGADKTKFGAWVRPGAGVRPKVLADLARENMRLEAELADALQTADGWKRQLVSVQSSLVNPPTWTVAGRGAMTPQQMADDLVAVDKRVLNLKAEVNKAWDKCEERRKEADSYRVEMSRLLSQNVALMGERDQAIKERDAVTVDLNRTKLQLDEVRGQLSMFDRPYVRISVNIAGHGIERQWRLCDGGVVSLTARDVAVVLEKSGWVVLKREEAFDAVREVLARPNQTQLNQASKEVVEELLKTSQR